MRHIKALRIFIVAVALCGVAAIVIFCSAPILEKLIQYSHPNFQTLNGSVMNRLGIEYYCSFDEPLLRDEITGKYFDAHCAKYTKGKFNGARKFESGYNGRLTLDYNWASFITSYKTLSFYIKPNKNKIPQSIIFFPNAKGSDNIIKLSDGVISLCIVTDNGYKIISKKLPKKNKWSHVALSFDTKNINFYVNGDFVGSVLIDEAIASIHPRLMIGGKDDLPYLGSIDELTIFSRCLSSKEIKTLSSGLSTNIPFSKHKSLKARASIVSKFVYSVFSKGLRTISRLSPMRNLDPVEAKDLPIISFQISKSDKKHFLIAHEESILSGYRMSAGGDLRKIVASIDGNAMECYAFLDSVYNEYEIRPYRPAFTLLIPEATTESEIIKPKKIYRLTPPELYSLKHPDAESILPRDCSKLVRFYVNNEFKGVYYIEDWQSNGRGWMISDNHINHNRMLYDAHSGEPTFNLNAELAREYILSDIYFPWSEVEVNVREKRHQERKTVMGYSGGGLHEFDFLGANVSPFMLKKPLQIPSGMKIVESSNPELICLDGRVFCERVQQPTIVDVSVAPIDDSYIKKLKFRVVPEVSKFTTLLLWIDRPLQKISKQDFLCSIQYAGETNSTLNYGFVGGKSGAKHRGNSSYHKGRKRSVSLEFENPHGVIGAPYSRHLVLVSGYLDRSRLRNAFSYEMFRKMNPGINVAPNLTYVDVSVNGEYAGIYEVINRIDDLSLPSNIVSALRIRNTRNLFLEANVGGFDEILPKANYGVSITNYLNLVHWLNTASTQEFRSQIGQKVFLENLVDFYLILNLTQNTDMINLNQILCFDVDGRMHIVPWDCDKTFESGSVFYNLKTLLSNRCLSESPEFVALLKQRWSQHRSTILSDVAIDEWINEKVDLISPYMEYELNNISKPNQFVDDYNFAESVEIVRQNIFFCIEELEKHIDSL